MDIIIDTKGESSLATKDCLLDSDEDDIEFGNSGTQAFNAFEVEEQFLEDENKTKKRKQDASKDIDLDEFENDMGWSNPRKRQPKNVANVSTLVNHELTPVDKVLAKSAIKPGFEQLESVSSHAESKRKIQAQRRKERSKTTGKNWFNMPAPEKTEEIRHDLEVIQMRSVLDPKHFYKKNDLKVLPKYFQIGKVVDTPLDYYSGRMTKKERKKTIVDELMADAEFSKYNKRKYKEIIDEKKKLHYKAHRHAKRLKGRKK